VHPSDSRIRADWAGLKEPEFLENCFFPFAIQQRNGTSFKNSAPSALPMQGDSTLIQKSGQMGKKCSLQNPTEALDITKVISD